MPKVYDPTGGTGLRGRRRRKRAASNDGRNFPNQPSQKLLTSTKDMVGGGQETTDGALDFVPPSNKIDNTKILEDRGGLRDLSVSRNCTSEKESEQPKSTTSTKTDAPAGLETFTGVGNRDPVAFIPESSANQTLKSAVKSDFANDSSYQYAIGIDTRYLNTPEGRYERDDFLKGVKDFLLSTFRRRGFSASCIAWTESLSSDLSSSSILNKRKLRALRANSSRIKKQTVSSNHVKVHTQSLEGGNFDSIVSSKIEGAPVRPPINHSNTKNRNAVHLPKGLMANVTWSVFGDLVHAIANCPGNNQPKPLRIVIFSSNASAFLDSNEAGHRRGIDSFWTKVQIERKFQTIIQKIDLIVVEGRTSITQLRHPSRPEVFGDSDGRTATRDKCCDQADASSEKANTKQEAKVEVDATSLIQKMGLYVDTKAEEDFKENKSRIQFDPKFVEFNSLVQIELQVIDSTTGYSFLCQNWSRRMIAEVVSKGKLSSSPTISLQLPETADFDSCELSFSIHYKAMPFPLNSPQAKQLSSDLKFLATRSTLEVVQLVPISSIDASSIYGVPIGLKGAPEENEQERNEKANMIQSLFRTLAMKDCAILIRSVDNQGVGGARTPPDACLFHSFHENQYFLVLPEWILSKEGPASSRSGILYRLVSVDHMLEITNANDLVNVSPPATSMIENPFSEYVETSLESLKCSAWNPWLHNERNRPCKGSPRNQTKVKAKSIETIVGSKESGLSLPSTDERKDMIPLYENKWTDDSGVGSVVKDSAREDLEEQTNANGSSIPSDDYKSQERAQSNNSTKYMSHQERYVSNERKLEQHSGSTCRNLDVESSTYENSMHHKKVARPGTWSGTDDSLCSSDCERRFPNNFDEDSSTGASLGRFHYGTTQ